MHPAVRFAATPILTSPLTHLPHHMPGALRCYSGPLFIKYNGVLRAAVSTDFHPFLDQVCKRNRYPTTIHVLAAAVVKLGKLTGAPRCVYRAPGGALPDNFWARSRTGAIGILEAGCLSTSTQKEEALTCAAAAHAQRHHHALALVTAAATHCPLPSSPSLTTPSTPPLPHHPSSPPFLTIPSAPPFLTPLCLTTTCTCTCAGTLVRAPPSCSSRCSKDSFLRAPPSHGFRSSPPRPRSSSRPSPPSRSALTLTLTLTQTLRRSRSRSLTRRSIAPLPPSRSHRPALLASPHP
jgi:hypothetical protein